MFGDVPLVMVSDEPGVKALAAALDAADVIAIDTESNGMFAYTERVCLIQFSVVGTDWIVDPLAFANPREALAPLAPAIADPNKPTVLHGADYDVRCLRRDFDWSIGGLFDTLIAAQLLAMPKVGLADLLGRFFGLDIDKQYQRYDWGIRPLKDEVIDYARGDTHYLMALRVLLERRLAAAGRLHHHTEECAFMQLIGFQSTAIDPDDAYFMKGADRLTDTQKRVLRRLSMFREREAARLDRPTYKTISSSILLDLAKASPATEDELDRILKPGSSIRRRYGSDLLDAIEDGLDDKHKVPKRRAKPAKGDVPGAGSPPHRNKGKTAERLAEALKAWRNDLCKNNPRYTSYNAVSNTTLKSIAAVGPETLDELREVPEIRNWQVEEFGEALLEVLRKNA